jgi:glycosyltransferase involved in cell wall biosynthesis
MKKIFYWSPYLSNVATIRNVLNSAYSLTKYDKKSFNVYILDVIGEWKNKKNDIKENNLNYLRVNRLNLNIKLPISGFLKSRIYSLLIFIFNIIPLFNLLKKERPEYLIVHLLTSIPLTLLFFFNFKTKFVLRISGLPRLNIFRKILWKIVNKKLFLITCPSQETLDYMRNLEIFDNNKLVLLYDPIINISIINKNFKKNLNLKKDFFLSIGRLTKQKNHLLLIKLFSKLKDHNVDCVLYILGDGEERNSLLQEIKKLNLENKVFLLGHKENVYPYILLSKAIISPSLWEDPGAVMIEAAYCNKIVISSDCKSGPKEFLMNNRAGYLFDNDNLNSLYETLNKFLKDDSEAVYLKKILAKKNSKKYSIYSHYIELKKLLN